MWNECNCAVVWTFFGVIIEAGKSKIYRVAWCCGGPRGAEVPGQKPSGRAGFVEGAQSAEVVGQWNSSQRRASLSVLMKPSTHWKRPTHFMKGNLLYSNTPMSVLIPFQKHPKTWFLKNIYLFLSYCCMAFSLVVARGGYSLAGLCGLLIVVAPLVVEHGLSCPTACGIFPDQGLNLHPPALAGGFLTTEPPGTPQNNVSTVTSRHSMAWLI